MRVFFSPSDYLTYLNLLATQARRRKLKIWSYCLMPNHVHLVATPSSEQGLAQALGEAHRRYALTINRRNGWTGHLWQERFSSSPMDERHLMAAVRYALLNPVRAGLAKSATDWPYSSARAHAFGEPDPLIDHRPMAKRVCEWSSYLSSEGSDAATESVRKRHHLGRPLGSDRFVEALEQATGRRLRRRKVGRKPKRK